MEKFIKRRLIFILIDLILVILSFLFVVKIKAGTLGLHLPRYLNSFLIFLSIWLVISWFFKKYYFRDYDKFGKAFWPIIYSNLVILGTITILMYFLRIAYFSRTIVFGTILVASLTELFLGVLYHFYKVAREHKDPADHEYNALMVQQANHKKNNSESNLPPKAVPLSENLKNIITEAASENAFHFIQKSNIHHSEKVMVLATSNPLNIRTQSVEDLRSIINLKRINDIPNLNTFFETVNETLPESGYFTCCVETKDLRKKRIFRKFPFPVNFFFYYFLDFPIKRVLPKFGATKRLYFLITRGENFVLTRAETLGRLISSGFKIIHEDYVDNLCYISCRKNGFPTNGQNPNYGLFVRLKRIGKNGKIINVVKLRTMYPYAEYLQEYVYSNNNLSKGGKFNNDFRISTHGKIMRKLWIDELPMIINVFAGNLKIVGVRPLSRQYYNLYSKELQKKRLRSKPGLIPPFYADLPKTIEDIQESERRYLDAYEKHPFLTDWKYFWLAWYNIIFRKARSQ